MRKWLKRIFAALGILLLVLFLAVYFGGRWAARKYLAREIAVGEGTVRLVSPEFRWSLDLQADSLLYDSPTLKAAAGATSVSADLFKSLLHFNPSVTLEVDTLVLRTAPGPDTVKPKPDSIPFPEFRIPARVAVDVGRIRVLDTAGPLVRADGVHLETRGPRAVRLSIRDLDARPLGGLRQSLAAAVSWEDSNRVNADLGWNRGPDSITLDAQLPKHNLLEVRAQLRAHVASTAPYARALNLPPAMPLAQGLDLALKLSLADTLSADARLEARLSGFPDSLPLKPGPQKISLRISFRDTAGTWSLAGRGDGGEDVDLKGNLFVTARDSLPDPAWLASHAGATASGHISGFTVVAGGERRKADLRIARLRASSEAVLADVSTGDGTRITADLDKAPASAVTDWNGTFSIQVEPGEKWLTAFTDTNVVFDRLRASGRIRSGTVSAVVEASGLKAYGLLADSLRLVGRYGKNGFELEPSHLIRNEVDWTLSGRAQPSRPGHPLSFLISNPRFGSAAADMPDPDHIRAQVRGLALEQLPYKGLDTLESNRPRLTADFEWDKGRRSGTLKLALDARFKSEALKAGALAHWDAERLNLESARVSLAGNEITASALLDLHGRHFYELAGLKRDDVEEVILGADHFDLAKALSVFLPEPPLKSGTASGRLRFAARDGFSGTYRLRNIHLNAEQEKLAVKELALTGIGDTLLIRAVTVSGEEPLFRDSVTVAVTGVLDSIQTLNVNAKAGSGIFLDFHGTVTGFRELQGRLGLRGNADLPGSSGQLRNVQVRAGIALPFKDGLKGLRLEADTLRGEYAVAGLDTQTFSAPVKMEAGRITIPDLTLKGRNGGELHGHFAFDPESRRMSGSVAGNSLAAQFGQGDKIKLWDLKVDLRGDSTLLELHADIGSGSAEHVKAPLRAAGDFSDLTVAYRAPLGKPTGPAAAGRTPYLRVDATLDSSEVRYRLRSMETLQNLFKRTPEKRTAKRSQAIQLEINVETSGSGNSIETDILRLNYVGNFSMAGIYPYALVQGRISSSKGELGVKKQAYGIRRMDVKWLNTPIDQGEVELEARKRLARNCETGTTDSCSITTRLTGRLSDLQFTYDSDCEGASGAGVEVAALVYSVRRGCYSSAISGGGSGLSYEQQALGLLEPIASDYLSDAFGKLSGHWISSAQISGLGSFAQDKNAKDTTGTEALALEILSKEFWRTRLRVRSTYAPENVVSSSPWFYRVGLEWRPPVPWFIDDPRWKRRIRNNVTVEAAIFTDPDRTQIEQQAESLRKRLGLNYTYDFWGHWWAKENADTAAVARRKPRRSANREAAVPVDPPR